MSIKLISEARNLKLKPPQKLILMLMADHASDEGTRCFPSIRRLAHDSGYSTKTVTRIVADLEKKGVVTTLSKGNQHAPSQYLITPSKGEQLPKFEPFRWAPKAERAKTSPASDAKSERDNLSHSPVREISEQVKWTNTTSEGDIALPQNRHVTINKEPSEVKLTTETIQPVTDQQVEETMRTLAGPNAQLNSAPGNGAESSAKKPMPPAIIRVLGEKEYDISTYQGRSDYEEAKARLPWRAK